jgi:hypothetical protein
MLCDGQVGWQDCITRLLVKRPISTPELQPSASLPDLMSFDEDNLELEDASYSPSSVTRLSTHVTDAALVIENEIKGNQLCTGLVVCRLALVKLCVHLAIHRHFILPVAKLKLLNQFIMSLLS